MADPRFHQRSGPFTLGVIAKRIGAAMVDSSAGELSIEDVTALDSAGPRDLSLFYDPRHTDSVRASKAAAIVTTRALAGRVGEGTQLLIAKDPRLAFTQAGYMFYPQPSVEPGIDPRAHIDPTAAIGPGCRIDPGAVIAAGVEIGPRCHIGAHTVIAAGVVIGADCRIGPNTAISHAVIGARVEIGSCCTIGGPGFGFVASAGGLLRVPQLGRVVIEDDVKIDANCAVDRGANGDTVIGTGTVIDNLVQIGHNVRIGRHCAIAGQTGIAGSTEIGDGVLIGGQVAISDHLKIGAGARIALKSGVCRDVEPGSSVGGYPAVPVQRWHRQTATLGRLSARPQPTAAPHQPAEAARRSNNDQAPERELTEQGAGG
ncbi:MAG TPA: UDP-3-O-(3-hydroxymyristoyl)glucosamine N-acyltransferase [Alphaproteobacteria bacterium]|nr:UDP-3-O-(3-hydroxymyristoyl)glucosamine N-acyltransferase [Alphaproteobacteria bacterium]